jgi:hypothetical protein
VPRFSVPAELETDLATVERGIVALRDAGGEVLDAEKRDFLLNQGRSGSLPAKLHVDVIAYRQPRAHNRNFVRFRPDILKALAASFVGAPFLRDHQQRNLDARGGTIIGSEYSLGADGPEFHQRLELNEPWAIGKALNGNLDRFSIGWHTTGDIVCSVCEAPMFKGDCAHWPGDRLDDGRVEAIVTGADGVETSAVLVPAVAGTGIEAIRSALALAVGPDHFAFRLARLARTARNHSKEKVMLAKLAPLLGLAEDADESTALAAVEKLKGERERTAALLDAEKGAHAATRAKLDELAVIDARRAEVERQAATARLLADCRRKVGQKLGADGKPEEGGTQSERVLLAIAKHSIPEAQSFVDELPQIVPVTLVSREPDDHPKRKLDALDAQLGLTAADIAKYGPGARGGS